MPIEEVYAHILNMSVGIAGPYLEKFDWGGNYGPRGRRPWGRGGCGRGMCVLDISPHKFIIHECPW